MACPMTGLGLYNGYRGNAWYKYRIEIFNKYTLKSLLNQTNRDFVLWIAVRFEEKNNPLTMEWIKYLRTIPNLNFIFTYGGCFFWDDKYKEDNLAERLKVILPQLKTIYVGEKYVYETIQPSDDFYHTKEVEEIQKVPYKERRILLHRKGYVMNSTTQELADWNPTTINPPFYTTMYPADTFFDARKHFDYLKGSKSHEDVAWLFDPVYMPDYRYCVLTHGNQISTTWYHPYREGRYKWEPSHAILKEFGIDSEKPSEIKVKVFQAGKMIRYFVYRILIRGQVYRILKIIKNKYELTTRDNR